MILIFMSEVIQWGHDLSAMNTRKNIPPGWASSVGFNGATTFRSWILRGTLPVWARGLLASMRPRPFGHGYGSGIDVIVFNDPTLQ